ncbi:MAG: ribbon-helix-helix protein, CopG family [Actinobacteria bacterium]|nr:ribbon-helix-helix protein, CopG family [Actinomycetota bacterium]
MLSVRLQVLIDQERANRLDEEARRRGVSVAAIVRDGIDAVLPGGPTRAERMAALARIKAAPPLENPPDPDEIRAMLAEAHDRVTRLG